MGIEAGTLIFDAVSEVVISPFQWKLRECIWSTQEYAGLARRPSQLALPKDVGVHMIHALAAILTCIEHNTVAID
jgi:hypothetical protein